MNIKKLFLLFMMGIMLGQGILASADTHSVFEESDEYYTSFELESSAHSMSESDHAGDECGHCCHTHCSSFFMASNILISADNLGGDFSDNYLDAFSSAYSDPALRPPIA